MIIRTRMDIGPEIFGDGEHIIAMDQMQLELLAAFLGMVKLGVSPYQEAASQLMDTIEELTGNSDFFGEALADIEPVLEIHDPDTYDVVARYDSDSIIEFIV